jgi:hypothetical protein
MTRNNSRSGNAWASIMVNTPAFLGIILYAIGYGGRVFLVDIIEGNEPMVSISLFFIIGSMHIAPFLVISLLVQRSVARRLPFKVALTKMLCMVLPTFSWTCFVYISEYISLSQTSSASGTALGFGFMFLLNIPIILIGWLLGVALTQYSKKDAPHFPEA